MESTNKTRKTKCWDRFASKTIIYFTGHKDTRVPHMEAELKRVGLRDASRQWQFPSPLNKPFMKSLKHVPMLEHGGWFNCSMGHYRAIATAYHLGCDSVLVMEDDIRFLNDTAKIAEVVNTLPSDYDIALFECSYRDGMWHDREKYIEWRDNRKVNDNWAEFDRMYSMACYALSRKGMESMLFCYDAVVTEPKIGMLRPCDHFMNREMLRGGKRLKMYFNRKNICIQQRMGKASSDMDVMFGRYVNMGLNLDDYADA